MANIFVDAFSSVFSADLMNSYPIQHCDSSLIFNIFSFDIFNIEDTLSKLKSYACCGPDGISSVFLKRCAPSICYPWLMFRKSISSTQDPKDWKDYSVMPLFKGGVKSHPLNYRPISLTSLCYKSFERIIVS